MSRLLLVPAAVVMLAGCGYVSEPLPPLMNIPGRAENLAVLQAGAFLVVHFTVPPLTTEGQVLKQSVRPDLRIGLKPAAAAGIDAWAAAAKPAGQGTVSNGLAEYRIPVNDWVGKEVALAVRIVGANHRDAGWTNPVFVTVVATPEQPHDLIAEAVPQGVRLAWQAADPAFLVLRRGPDEKEFTTLGRVEKPEYVDATAQFEKPYTYLVVGVVKAGAGEAHSEASPPAAITPVDTFPPAAPVGLTAVPSTASIELVWERSAELSITAYRIYRATGSGPFQRIGETPLATYSDRQIQPATTYRYTVAAVKKNGRESVQSAAVEASTP